jgi:hypothetical protein
MVKKYLYREDDTIFYKLEQIQKLLGATSLRAVMTAIINKGIMEYCKENNVILREIREKEAKQEPLFVLTDE